MMAINEESIAPRTHADANANAHANTQPAESDEVGGFLEAREMARTATRRRRGFAVVVGAAVLALQLLAHANVVPPAGADLALSFGALAVGFSHARG